MSDSLTTRESVCPSCRTVFDSALGMTKVRGVRVVTFCSTACADVAPHAELLPSDIGDNEPPAPEITIISADDPTPDEVAARPLDDEPAQVEVHASESETAEVHAFEPETAEPETVESETAEPETAEPETAEPETAEPVIALVTGEQPEPEQSEMAESDTADADSAEGLSEPVAARSVSVEADDIGDHPGEEDRADDLRPVKVVSYSTGRSTRKSKIIALSAAMLVGGVFITIISTVSPSAPSNVSAERSREGAAAATPALVSAVNPASAAEVATGADQVDTSQRDPAGPAPATAAPATAAPAAVDTPADAPATPSLEAMYDEAGQVLNKYLASPSTRLQRIAAGALARTGDQAAIARLRELLASERVELRKIEIAYALARSGDKEAVKLLRRRLTHKRRDVRVDAARSLVILGNDTGQAVLERMLSVRSHRLGAAGLLARSGVPRGVKVLKKALADRKTSKENKMRAAVALGLAGEQSVRARLLELLADNRYSVGAAAALAALSDLAAVDTLQRQLALPSLRVQAALGLRRLGADADLRVLEAALDHGSDPARVSAAEAILILAGPESIAEFD